MSITFLRQDVTFEPRAGAHWAVLDIHEDELDALLDPLLEAYHGGTPADFAVYNLRPLAHPRNQFYLSPVAAELVRHLPLFRGRLAHLASAPQRATLLIGNQASR